MKRMLWCVLAMLAGTAGVAGGQEGAAGGPLTYALARKANYVPLETLRSTRSRIPAPLARPVSIQRDGALLQQVLLDIANQAELGLSYGEDLVRAHVTVSLSASNEPAADALQRVTAGTDWAVLVTPAGQVAVLRREPGQVGVIAGSITDRKSGTAIGGATVVVEGTSLGTTSGSDGRYRIPDVAPGTYTVRARYIGYAPGAAPVTVTADQEATADIALEKSVQQLNEVVTTGTLIPTEVKALPTPVSVIDAEEFALQRPLTVQELFRKVVPGSLGWDFKSAPYNTTFSVRGSSSIGGGGTTMKVFVDGVEAASGGFSQVDPTSIARMEVIRGPQAAAIYGSDAIGGAVQIFTKRGDASLVRPQVTAEANMGLVETPYPGYGGSVRQEYRASIRGGGSDVGYSLGAGYSHLGDWLPPRGEVSRQSNPTVYAGVNFARGIVSFDLSGRYYVQDGGNRLVNPEITETGYVPFSKPSYQPLLVYNQTVGARLGITPTRWWRNSVTVGVDRYSDDLAQTQPRLTTPEDTLLLVGSQFETKTSIGLTSTVDAALGGGVSGSLTAGFDHWSHPISQWYSLNALNTTGSIATEPAGLISVTRTTTNNTGYFTQAQLAFRDAVFLTAGLRAERNTNFGDSLGTPLQPRVGISYVHSAGQAATLKLRGSWGRALRPPSPGRKLGFASATVVQLANPLLGPDRQRGWDAGIDAIFGDRGSLSLTWYRQIAENLADAVVVATSPVYTQQFQNVGRVKNAGLEVEGALSLGWLSVRGQYGYIASRIEALSPTYAGDMRVGDRPLLTPAHTAGVSLTAVPIPSTTVSAGLVYVGSWNGYNTVGLFRCFGGTGPCGETFRDYQMRYPALFKANLSIFHRFGPHLSGFVAVDNLTDNNRFEADNLAPPYGRASTVGLRLEY